ncbi:MAG: phenylacetate--CoA ligase, partial [Angelakisella sp.]
GMHLWEDHFLPEIVDSNTLEPLPEGSFGELIITTLTKEGFPLLRYRTKDITKLDYSPCACGRTHVRMAKVTGRSDDMLKIRGVNVFPSQIESTLMTIEEVGPHYQLIVRRQGFMDTLEVKVELLDESLLEKYSQLEKVEAKVLERLKTVLGIEVAVTLSNPKSLERFEGKAKRIVDLR